MDWVSSLAYSWKADGDLRTCLNPTHLNKAIRRDHYRTPTLEEITHELAGSTKFTKVDGSSSYYWIVLNYESSLLTTFNTHRGRFCFVHLPFGLTCAQNIFQRMMDQILDRCEGVIGIAGYIIVHGKDDAEYDRRLHKFMKVAREHGLVLNKKKCEVKSKSVKFFGCVYDKHGAHPDPSKVSAIKEMPAPQNKGELQSFLGMVTYLSPFIPQLSSHTATLRGLLKTDVEYSWNATYQVAFDKLKSLVCEDTTLRYFNTKKPVTIQVDASSKGLRAKLIQDDVPVAFASKALTPTEQSLCKQWEGTTRLHLQCRTFPDICFWWTLHDWEWPQITRTDLYKESGRCPSMSTEDVTPTSWLRFHNQVLPRRGNDYSRHLIEILSWGYTRDSPRHLCQPYIHQCWEEMRLPTHNQGWPTAKCYCRHNHHWMARWYQGCSKSTMTIPWTMWFTHCRGWTYPTWRSNHCSPGREEEGLGTDPPRTLRHIQVPIQG